MAVLSVVPNLPARDPAELARFYEAVFGLSLTFDMGWIAFLGGAAMAETRLQLAREGGSGTELPAISILVDDLDPVLAALRATGAEPVYGPVTEPWGIRRFYLRDPEGNLVNVARHEGDSNA